MNKEECVPVFGFEGIYEVSRDGVLYSLNYHRQGIRKEKKSRKGSSGYLNNTIFKNGEATYVSMHRLVWESFNKQKIPKNMQIHHIDENKLNNSIDNLKLVTQYENNHAGSRGERAGKAVALAQGTKVKTTVLETGEVKIFNSINEAGRYYKVRSKSKPHACVKNEYGVKKNIYSGVKWEAYNG